MKKFKKEVKNVNETNFWAQQENGDQKYLICELKTYKRYVFRNNFGNNPKTGQDWTSQDVIIDLLLKEDLLWLQQDSLLHYIMSPS